MTHPIEIDSPERLQAVMGTDFAPSPQQWQAITAPLGPAVVIAGAGSGKTTLMAARVVYLVVTGQVRPEQVLGLTFTTKAASQLRTKVVDALRAAGALDDRAIAAAREPAEHDPDAETLEPTVLTYHAYAAALLSEHGLRIGHEPDTRVLTDAARYQLGARVVERHTDDVRQLSDHPPTVIQNLLALDGAMSEHLVGADDVRRVDDEARRGFVAALEAELAGKNRATYREPCEKGISAIDRRRELLGLVAGYRRLKADLSVMDFSDQIELGARLARDQPGVGALEREKFRVVLLDEYQDTSVAQALMLARLFSGPDVEHGLGHPVTAVGDPNQAIYGWRGASVSNILGFAATFPARPDAESAEPALYHLTVSRRSVRRIVEAANLIAAPLYARYAQVEPLRAADDVTHEGRVTVAAHHTAPDELDALVADVRAAHEPSSPGEPKVAPRWSDVGVLTRDNLHAGEVFDALGAAGIPVEIVGLSGLLRLPEVAEVVAVLHLLDDVTANASMLTLLSGPRWAIGPRDLALLSDRARQLADGESRRSGARADRLAVVEQLLSVADGLDPAEIPALDDAVADPGDQPYSSEARERFALLATELRRLRGHVGEPLLDLVRRILDVTGVDVELASAVSPSASARRDNLDLFVKAVADFQAVDGDVTLPALLAYLTAEDDAGNALDMATPTEADSVKLLTVHRAKGLEWPAVFLVGVCEQRFPSTRSRSLWVSSPQVLPAPLRGDAHDLPQLTGHDKAAVDAYRQASRDHDAEEERRLGYVAVTRPARLLSVSSYCWSGRKTPFGPSPYQVELLDLLRAWEQEPTCWHDKPEKGTLNPLADADSSAPWPVPGPGEEPQRRLEAAARVAAADPAVDDTGLDVVQAALVAQWDDEIERLLAEARRDQSGRVEVPLPASLSATSLARLRDDPQAFARELARPMPRPPAPAARFGTRFHAWVEARFGQQTLLATDELAGRGDTEVSDVADEVELAELVERFEQGRFADREPFRVEAAFALVLGGQVVRGRIDAVYRADATDADWLVVDWKTSRRHDADPVQLAIYRLAWAELVGVDPSRVRAGFYYVRDDVLVEPDLPDRAALVELLGALDE